MRLKDKVAIITGSASGIGKVLLKRLPKKGAKVVIADMNIDEAQATATEFKKNGYEAMAVSMDVTSEQQVDDGYQSSHQSL